MNPESNFANLKLPTCEDVMAMVAKSNQLLHDKCAGLIDDKTFDKQLKELTRQINQIDCIQKVMLRLQRIEALILRDQIRSKKRANH